eukprot:4233749-Prorocentrum_lima.AAC.1
MLLAIQSPKDVTKVASVSFGSSSLFALMPKTIYCASYITSSNRGNSTAQMLSLIHISEPTRLDVI